MIIEKLKSWPGPCKGINSPRPAVHRNHRHVNMADAIKQATPSTSSVKTGENAPVTPTSRAEGSVSASASIHLPTAAAADPSRQEAQEANHHTPAFGARPACFKSTFQEVAFVSQATIATATSSFFQGASAILTASIGRDLGMSQGQITWITASTALTAGAFQLGLGQLADLLGRKPVFLAGMASFAAFALLVAWARDPFWMDIVCGLLGVCAAMVVPPAIGIMGAAYERPSKRKNLAFSAFSAGNPLGFVFGSVVSGLATMAFNWRASYVLIAILWVVFAVLAVWTIPEVEAYPPDQAFGERARQFVSTFDFVGTALTIIGTGLLTAAIT